MGMAFNRVTWNKLRKCASQFCSYDDYNWDWSLQHVAQSCLPPSKGAGTIPRVESGLIAMMMRAPRVFHIGEWYNFFLISSFYKLQLPSIIRILIKKKILFCNLFITTALKKNIQLTD